MEAFFLSTRCDGSNKRRPPNWNGTHAHTFRSIHVISASHVTPCYPAEHRDTHSMMFHSCKVRASQQQRPSSATHSMYEDPQRVHLACGCKCRVWKSSRNNQEFEFICHNSCRMGRKAEPWMIVRSDHAVLEESPPQNKRPYRSAD